MQIAGELFAFSRALVETLKPRMWGLFILCMAFPVFIAATPTYFNALDVSPKLGPVKAFTEMKELVKGEPIFSLLPYPAYLSGGSFRLLPNDSLEKVVEYGHRTGVRWLLISWTKHTMSQLTFYDRTGWYESRSLEGRYPGLVRFRCSTPDGSAILYELL